MLGAKQYLGAGVIAVIAFLLLSATFSFAAESITNTYDELNRLTKSVFGSRFTIEYSYDAFGNRSQKKITMLDSSAPDTAIVSKPNSFSTASVTFTFTSETNASFECQLDSGAWSACNSGSMSYDGLADGNHTFNVKATDRSGNTDTTSASYTWQVATLSFTITASAGSNGSITPSGSISVMNHANQTFTITPVAGYRSADVLVDGVSVGAGANYTFTDVIADHVITATFAMDIPLSPSGLSANMGAASQVNLNWTDNSNNEGGFKIERKTGSESYQQIALVGTNVNVYSDLGLTPNSYTYRVRAYNDGGDSAFSNEAVVIVQTYTITASAGANGSISPSGAVKVFARAGQTFTISPAAGYAVAEVTVDGASLGVQSSYTFSNVTTDHTISASFCNLNLYYQDFDQDGYGNTSMFLQSCIQPSGYVTDNTDCNDKSKIIHPGAIEICNGKDDDCDEQTDNSCVGGVEMGFVSYFLSADNWLIRAYSEGAAGAYSLYVEIRDINNVLVPAGSIAGLSDNPYTITYDATMPDVVLYFDKDTKTAYVLYTTAAGKVITPLPGIMASAP